MDPIPETVEAAEQLAGLIDADVLLEGLNQMGEQVREVVPDCVGLSLTYVEQRVTFTLVASAEEIALLDALQYLAGGPCVRAVERDQTLGFAGTDVMDEEGWRLFARGSAATGVASTLSLPIRMDGRVIGGVNLYGGSAHAFAGHHEELASRIGAWAPGAVTNADMSFSTRGDAVMAPALLLEEADIDRACGVLVASEHVDLRTARRRLREAAVKAGLTEAQVAAAVLRARKSG